jgi:hypothetical protein
LTSPPLIRRVPRYVPRRNHTELPVSSAFSPRLGDGRKVAKAAGNNVERYIVVAS